MISPRTFFRSMRHALRGLAAIARDEHSFRLQLVMALAVGVAAVVLPLATWERILLVLIVAAVLVLEIMNSILERLADALQPRLSMVVKEVKDMMAGAVLIVAATAVVVGVFIFWPHVSPILVQALAVL